MEYGNGATKNKKYENCRKFQELLNIVWSEDAVPVE